MPPTPQRGGTAGPAKGWIKTYDWVISLLREADFADAARRMKIDLFAEGELRLRFTGRLYAITKDSITLREETVPRTPLGEETEYNLCSALGYYALSAANVEPSGEYCLMESFSNGVFSSGRSGLDYMSSPLRKAIEGDKRRFEAIAEKLRFTRGGKMGSGDTWTYDLLPKLPVKLVYYEGDDEFPSDVRVLYDTHAIIIFNFETLAVLHSCFLKNLAALA